MIEPQQSRTITFDDVATDAAEVELFADVTPVGSPNEVTIGALDCAAIGAG